MFCRATATHLYYSCYLFVFHKVLSQFIFSCTQCQTRAMGNDLSVPNSNSNKSKTESFLHCSGCDEWVGGNYVLGKEYPCFNAPGCLQILRPLDYPPSPHFYHCLCGNLDIRSNYTPLVLGCSHCGDLVSCTSPQSYSSSETSKDFFLCN